MVSCHWPPDVTGKGEGPSPSPVKFSPKMLLIRSQCHGRSLWGMGGPPRPQGCSHHHSDAWDLRAVPGSGGGGAQVWGACTFLWSGTYRGLWVPHRSLAVPPLSPGSDQPTPDGTELHVPASPCCLLSWEAEMSPRTPQSHPLFLVPSLVLPS